MARKPIISRTIKSYNAKVLIFDNTTNEMRETDVTTSVDTDKARQAALSENERLLKTLETQVNEAIFGMTVDEFMQYAKPITRGKNEETKGENE